MSMPATAAPADPSSSLCATGAAGYPSPHLCRRWRFRAGARTQRPCPSPLTFRQAPAGRPSKASEFFPPKDDRQPETTLMDAILAPERARPGLLACRSPRAARAAPAADRTVRSTTESGSPAETITFDAGKRRTWTCASASGRAVAPGHRGVCRSCRDPQRPRPCAVTPPRGAVEWVAHRTRLSHADDPVRSINTSAQRSHQSGLLPSRRPPRVGKLRGRCRGARPQSGRGRRACCRHPDGVRRDHVSGGCAMRSRSGETCRSHRPDAGDHVKQTSGCRS